MRLGKQRVEAYQTLKVLLGLGKRNKNGKLAWENHPAVKMWKGYELSLYHYTRCIIEEWVSRGYKDTVMGKINELKDKYILEKRICHPPWLMYNEEFHSSHRAALLAKNYEYYKQFNWKEKPEINYIWPE